MTMIVPKGELHPGRGFGCESGHGGHPPAVSPDGASAHPGEAVCRSRCPPRTPRADQSTTTAGSVMRDMDGKIAAVLDGGACGVGVESTVITLALEQLRVCCVRAASRSSSCARCFGGEVDVAAHFTRKSGMT